MLGALEACSFPLLLHSVASASAARVNASAARVSARSAAALRLPAACAAASSVPAQEGSRLESAFSAHACQNMLNQSFEELVRA